MVKVIQLLKQSDLQGVRTIAFNCPERLNAWSGSMMSAICNALMDAAADKYVQAVILTGTGKFYCSGVDFAGLATLMPPKKLKTMIEQQNCKFFQSFIDFPKPLFAAVNGPALGGAVTSMLLVDGVVASESATFSTPFSSLGLAPEGCSTYTYPDRFGPDLTKQLFNGRVLLAKEALEIGMVDKVVPREQLQSSAQKMAETWVISERQKYIDEKCIRPLLHSVNAEESKNIADCKSSKFLIYD